MVGEKGEVMRSKQGAGLMVSGFGQFSSSWM